MGRIILIVFIFTAITFMDIMKLATKKKRKEMILYISFAVLSLGVSIFIILSYPDVPSIATFYKKLYGPIMLK